MNAKQPAIALNRATVYIDEKLVLKELSITIGSHEHVAILGPNGSGKSTFIKLLSGDLHPLHRDDVPPISLFGETVWDLFELRNRLGIVTNELHEKFLKAVTGREVILSGFYGSIGLFDYQKITPVMKSKTKETARFMEIEHLMQRPITDMSSGEARRVLIARALVHDPKMLVLDEPFNSLDIKGRLAFGKVVRKLAQKGHSLLLVTHALEEILPEIDRVIMIKEGRLFADGRKEEVLNSKIISGLFNTKLKVEHEHSHYWVNARL